MNDDFVRDRNFSLMKLSVSATFGAIALACFTVGCHGHHAASAQHDTTDEMVHVRGEQHSAEADTALHHGDMNHGDMNHGEINHGDMKHGAMERGGHDHGAVQDVGRELVLPRGRG
ncbi:MAG: hypothetical protein AAFY15_14440, partial [Cyanobacteria bacterium J06648_11]